MPPPAPPSLDARGRSLGGSTLSAADMQAMYFNDVRDGESVLRPYGLGPRVPMYIVSPWSQGGWVCSDVFDHTSTIRFLEARFGVHEPNISAWHRGVSGDLTSCFDFTRPRGLSAMPDMRIGYFARVNPTAAGRISARVHPPKPLSTIAQLKRMRAKVPDFGAFLMLAHNWANFERTKHS